MSDTNYSKLCDDIESLELRADDEYDLTQKPSIRTRRSSNRALRSRFVLFCAMAVGADLALRFQGGLKSNKISALPSRRWISITAGDWNLPLQRYSDNDSLREWGSPARSGWHLPDDVDGMRVSTQPDQRAAAAVSYQWIPLERPEALRSWDGYQFIKRCLNSALGIVFVGGPYFHLGELPKISLNDVKFPRPSRFALIATCRCSGVFAQIFFRSVNSLLPTRFYEEENPFLYVTDSTQRISVTLDPRSNLYAQLSSELANVPRSRFDQPLIRFVRNDLLLPFNVTQALAQSMNLTITPIVDVMRFYDYEWEQFLLPSITWPHQQNSYLVLNTGAHWTPNRLNLSPGDIFRLMNATAKELLPRVIKSPHLNFIFRSVSPGAPRCNTAFTPLTSTPGGPVEMVSEPGHPEWGWQTFGAFDQLWADALDHFAPAGLSFSGKVAFLNITGMAGQRPDAHMGGGDCLHWLNPGIPSVWAKMLGHVVNEWG